MNYETVIGLEVHVELATESKIFCSCSAKYGAEQNDSVCPACCGMPGMLPVTNKHVVDLGIMAGLLTNCRINRVTTFDKKSYYYPDLPCSYQITQWFSPICVDGGVEIETSQGKKIIGLKQIHMEEDAGKLVHDDWTDTSLVDFNRTSVPLCEIVSKPDLRSVEEVIAYLERLRTLLRFARVSNCRWEEGSMRCDVNLSIRPEGSTELGVRTEMKNMNSLSAIARAIEYEQARHIDALERGTEVLVQETRRWDDVKGQSFAMRNKETAADYRYFPDPNLVPIIIDDEWFDRVKSEMPELPEVKAARYVGELGLTEKDAETLTASRAMCDVFEAAYPLCGSAKDTASWLIGDCMGMLRKKKLTADDIAIDPVKLAEIIKMVTAGEINRNAGRRVLAAVMDEDADPRAYCEKHGLAAQNDEGAILEVVKKAIAANEKSVQDYKNGRTKAMQAIFGSIMKELRGNGDPQTIQRLLKEELDK
ncbi:MAG: Asp-tRNA(Asn)/Glu-tRNA(Gln) amidotransferase subunit GatB [Oscillospiraceae bacterium]|nr:Asp-tRNA(Asn)/Glu-tRNA(Gln) amidotransferase subunit GatB [Oscillospiraceae bacterium]